MTEPYDELRCTELAVKTVSAHRKGVNVINCYRDGSRCIPASPGPMPWACQNCSALTAEPAIRQVQVL